MQLLGIAAMSLDGCLTCHDRPGTGFASAEDHAFFQDALQTFDCSIAGRRTYEAAREAILRAGPGPRLQIVLTSTPGRFTEARTDHLEFRNAGVAEVARELTRRGRTRCALLGGTGLYTEACALGLLDELWVTIEPVAFGEGVRMFRGPVEFRFELAESVALSGNTLVLKYRRLGG
ncbi:MAG: dihydrofolate reductase family protein [Vicinamibacteria bacterium]|nr:dihydrofolate reductase family protein [Vicinamibacteria bacterium]